MAKEKRDGPEAPELRRRAEEELLRAKTAEVRPLRTEAELQRLLYELEVHQIELEMQNAELLKSRDEAETASEKYSDLYDFAPVGYFTLDRDRVIHTANLTGATLLGIERARLIGRRFDSFLSPEDRPTIIPFFGKVFENCGKQACEVTLLKEGNSPTLVQIEAVTEASGHECRIALIDISDRKQAEEALRKSEKRYHSLFENMLEGFAYCKMLYDELGSPVDFVYLDVNSAFGRLTGLENAKGKRVTELIPGVKESAPELFETYGRVALTGKPERFEIEFKPLALWLSVSVYSLEKEHFVTVFDDITVRKRAECVVQARFRMMAAAGMSLGDMLQMMLDEIEAQTGSEIGFFHFLDADQETLLLQRWSSNTLQNMCSAKGEGCHYPLSQAGVWVDCVHERRPVIHNDYASLPNRRGMPPGHAPVIREMVIPILRGERIVAIIGVGNKPTDYNTIDIEIASLLGDFSWEIVDRKMAEERLRKSERQLAEAQSIAHIGSWEWDSISDRITGSDEFKRIFGLVLSSYDSFLELVHPDDRETVNRAVEETHAHQAPYNVHYRINRPDGITRIIHAQGSAITDGAGRTVRMIGTCQDVTERREMEGKLETLLSELAGRAFELEGINRELETANIGLEAFNYTVAHDLRKPLTNINGFCQVMKLSCAGQNEECRMYIREIYEATLRMDQLINTLLKFSRTLRTEMSLGTVDLSAVAREVAASLEMGEPERYVTFRIADGITVNGDANLLSIVLNNLIGNAWKYSGNREETVIEFGVEEMEGMTACFVRDNGSGFAMADADKLFVPFKRLHETDVEGHGIGLSTVERIIRRHGGRVWAEGEPGKGATFYFTLTAEGPVP